MARKGPVTLDTTTVALGLAQIRVGDSADNIADIQPALSSTDSIGALAETSYTGNVDWFTLESGFPLIKDAMWPIREAASLTCAIKEITPVNMALTYGHDPGDSPYSDMDVHSGEVPIGDREAPDYLRMEACYTYPDGEHHMYIIFPRAQATSNAEVGLAAEDAAAVPVTFEAGRADSEVSGGNAVWDDKPLGRFFWD